MPTNDASSFLSQLLNMRVLILGGTGPLGRALIRNLRESHADAHIAIVSRTISELPGASRVIAGDQVDIVPSPEFASDLASFDAIVHLGDGLGRLQEGNSAGLTREADRLIAASELIVQAAARARVPLLVYVSSIKALCDEDDERILVEDSAPRPTTLYGRSKLRLERAVASVLGGSVTRHVIIRNPVTYGTAGSGSIHRLIRLADTPLPLPLGGLANRRSVLARRNFASAIGTVLRTGRDTATGVFHIHDGPPLSTTQMIATIRAALGRPLRLFPIGSAAKVACHVPVAGPLARRLYGSLELSDARFRSTFAWTPEITSEVGLAEMARTSPRATHAAG